MKVEKLLIRGALQTNYSAEGSAGTLELEQEYVIGTFTRGAAELHEVALTEDHVVEFVFEDETVWFSSSDTVEDLFPEMAAQKRSWDTGFEVPLYLQSATAERGIVKDIALKILRIFVKKAVAKGVRELAKIFEDKQLNGKTGLFRLDRQFQFRTDIPQAGTEPFLLFLHGTASSTNGSFDKLLNTPAWDYIGKTYGNNVLAFQHRTLTESPLDNVLELLSGLPDQVNLHLVSHSRGGLVGDVLSRFCITNEHVAGFSAQELNYLREQNRTDDLEQIEAIGKLIARKNIRITRFVRVACPASGTTLASKRLDRLFNILFNLLGLALGVTTGPVYIAFKELMGAVLASKDDVDALPGIEAMNPESPFVKVLNNPVAEAVVDTPLMILSGNSQLNLSWKALVVIATKLFFTAKNDFIVNTASMYNGTRRAPGVLVQYFFDEGAEVDHFHYFANKKTNEALLQALQSEGGKLIPGFQPYTRTIGAETLRNALLNLEMGQVFKDTVTGKRPIAVVLPGIMGSNLTRQDKLLWINYFRFIAGELPGLEIGAQGVKAPSLIRTSYKKLVDHLSDKYDVVTFPFDWRLPLTDSAALFAAKIKKLLDYGQPVRIVAHSMGGVLVRDFIVHYPDAWKQLNASPGFRLVFLGAPLGGSFRIPYVLYGKDPIIDKLSKIDIFHNKEQLLNVFSKLPGLLNLLPLTTDPDNDFASMQTWLKMNAAMGRPDWPTPGAGDLEQFRAYRDYVNERVFDIDYSNAVYIAGRDKSTPNGYRVDNGQLVFLSTAEGDQSVTWASGIPAKMIEQNTVYYTDVTHGALANEPAIFKGIDDILETGSTNLLRTTRPSVRGIEKEFITPEMMDFDYSPEGIENTILGLQGEQVSEAGILPLQVTVSNGDLRYAAYPLLAGHFSNDGILYAEKAIDTYLGGALSERHALGLYPGQVGSSEVLLSGRDDLKGAVIVGLGNQGSLTAYLLMQTVEQGIANYLVRINSRLAYKQEESIPDTIGISSLIIGCGYGGLSIESSISAVLQGVQNANNKVRIVHGEQARIVECVEFVEQYQDRALGAIVSLNNMLKDERQALSFRLFSRKIKELFGLRKRLPIDNTDEWWTRISVREDAYTREGKRIAGLQFNISTGGAREEQRYLYASRDVIRQLLDELSVNNQWTPELARTVFELLIPNDFKEQLKKQGNINWILDKNTAAYPWELLQDSVGRARPLSVNAGMIRQLATQDYRLKISPVTLDNALVVGDPDLKGFVGQLPGALEEARQVAETLGSTGFEVTSILRGTAGEIIQGLFRSDYKIIHLAGHGVFNEDAEAGSGMVIGKDVYLSTREIAQMSTVPELVFVNCCFLGRTDSVAEAFYRDRYRLAANIGTQLIDNGVKAVVVAGWAVDDAAALTFTQVFYRCMLGGDRFGDAVKEARKVIFEQYGNRNNTWGAYQCYGDPFYRLRIGPSVKKEWIYDFTLAEEAEMELANLLSQAEASGVQDTLRARLQSISEAVEAAQIRNARITELEALIYTALLDYGMAVVKYASLLTAEEACYSFSAMEKYCNVRVKYEVQQYRQNATYRKKAHAGIVSAIKDLQVLISSYGATGERLNFIGSAYKRKAFVGTTEKQKLDAYVEAASYYRQAYERPATRNSVYALTNWLQIENVLVRKGIHKWGVGGLWSKDTAMAELNKIITTLQTQTPGNMNFWDMIAVANLRLCLLILEAPSVSYNDVLEMYRKVWHKAGSKGKKVAEIEYCELLADMLRLPAKTESVLKMVLQLKQALEQML